MGKNQDPGSATLVEGGELTREVRVATVHKAGLKIPT
jgi:hypothetical protein